MRDKFLFLLGCSMLPGEGKRAEGFDSECVGFLNCIFGVFFLDFLSVFGSTVFPKFVEISADFLVFLGFFV